MPTETKVSDVNILLTVVQNLYSENAVLIGLELYIQHFQSSTVNFVLGHRTAAVVLHVEILKQVNRLYFPNWCN